MIGVDDDRRVVGISEDKAQWLLETLAKSVYESCSPPILPQIYLQRFEEGIVVVINVSPGNQKPYFLNSLGPNDGVFIWSGLSTLKATAQLRDELVWESRGKTPDARPVYDAHVESIDIDAFQDFLSKRATKRGKAQVESALRHYGIVVNEHGRDIPTVGGLLLFGREPARYLPEASIIVTEHQGIQGREVSATRDFSDTLFSQYQQSYDYLLTRLDRAFTIRSRKRIEEFEIPEVAIREVLVNAKIHRHYGIPAPIKVSLYPNRVEIFSPGSFPGPLDPTDLRSGFTFIRNSIITRVFREAGYVEKLGSGLLTLFDSYNKAQLSEPTVEGGAAFVKCTLPRPAKNRAIKTKSPAPKPEGRVVAAGSKELISYIKKQQRFSTADIVEALDVSRQTAVRYLAELVSQNVVERIGKGPATRYEVVKNRQGKKGR